MLSPKEIDDNYRAVDPWQYQSCPADIDRKARILFACKAYAPYARALDIGCGEGWITKDLPAAEIYGYELSAKARERFPPNVTPLDHRYSNIKFDLVTMTGVLYADYDWRGMLDIALTRATWIVVTSHIEPREIPDLVRVFTDSHFDQVFTCAFTYDRPEENYVQRLRVFKKQAVPSGSISSP